MPPINKLLLSCTGVVETSQLPLTRKDDNPFSNVACSQFNLFDENLNEERTVRNSIRAKSYEVVIRRYLFWPDYLNLKNET